MPTLLLRFPGGRYHATPWGHHANEGLVEWPPSPWRLLRAFIACGYATQGWCEVPPAGKRLIESLAGSLPRYRLPAASVSHSRHFMPTGVLDKGREKTTLVFDTWADVGDGALAVRWDCSIDDDARSLFGVLAAHLGYLGRSESWVEAQAIDDDAELPVGADAYPHITGERGDRGWEQVSLIAAEPASAYDRWREQCVAKALDGFPLPEGSKKPGKKVEKARADAAAPYPIDLIDALQRDTAWWKRHGWSQPPGSRRVLYWRRSDALSVGPPAPAARMPPATVTTMLLALTTPSGSRSALPLLGRALPQAELLHRALVARASGGDRGNCRELTGKDATRKPLTGHQHAHLLPVDLDVDGHLDHIIVHAPMGLGPNAQRALRGLKRTWTKGGVGELRVALAGQGGLDDLRALPAPLDAGIAALLGPARIWTSFSPLVLPRYQKVRGANALAGQVNSELTSRGLPPAKVEVLPWEAATRHLRHAVRVRRFPAKPPPVDAGFAIRLVFEQPARGPIALGYGCHFGLGLFSAVNDEAK
ncbi:MAG: type I-G CRISPR-associated protein Csb2 [Myxococcaceae bacterium]